MAFKDAETSMFFPLFATVAALAPFTGATTTVEPISLTEAQDTADAGTKGFNYNFVEADLLLGGDLSGPRFRVSKPFMSVNDGKNELYYTGSFSFLSGDFGPVDVDLMVLSGGVTYVHNMSDSEKRFDLVASAELEFAKIDVGNADDTDIGLLLRGGARYQAAEKIEAFGGLSIHTGGDFNGTVFEAGARYDFSDTIDLQGGIEFGDDDTIITLGARYSF